MTERLEDTLRGRIAYDGTRTPLKTVLFLLVCFAWLLPGLVGHDPWKSDEAISFGIVLEMLRTGDWVIFRVAGEPYFETAPLFLWVAALSAKLWGGILPLHDAARLAAGLFMAITLGLISLTAVELTGERALRLAVLLFIGCLGLLIRAHEMNPDLAGLTGIALGLYGLALATRRPYLGGLWAGLGVGVAFLGTGFLSAALLLALMAILPLAGPWWRSRSYAATVAVALVCAAPLLAAWPLLLASASNTGLALWFDIASTSRWSTPFAHSNFAELVYLLRILPWYTWPAWPLAAWAVWRSRRTLGARRDLLLPLIAFATFLVLTSLFGEAREVKAMPLLLPLAILGVAELESLPRGAASALDWFGMTTFFFFAALLWVAWLAATTGSPQIAAAWLAREVPGYRYPFNFLAFALAALLTLIWLVVEARSLRSTRRALVNWAAGITMVWMLMMTLGLPLVDQARSYRAVAARLVQALPADFHCVAGKNLGDAQRALLDYFVGLRTVRLDSAQAAGCNALLLQATPERVPPLGAEWSEIWRGSRPGDRNEIFILYRRR
ncbi:MAG TPA: glycosyltransferase family 39 protein [Usitatibacter sp.]|nr:glycosyltransferase family 39 protein [Usitatibacter sp.]